MYLNVLGFVSSNSNQENHEKSPLVDSEARWSCQLVACCTRFQCAVAARPDSVFLYLAISFLIALYLVLFLIRFSPCVSAFLCVKFFVFPPIVLHSFPALFLSIFIPLLLHSYVSSYVRIFIRNTDHCTAMLRSAETLLS